MMRFIYWDFALFLYFVVIAPGFHKMLSNGTSSTNLKDISVKSAIVIPLIGCAVELYTAGCEVSLKEGKKKTLR